MSSFLERNGRVSIETIHRKYFNSLETKGFSLYPDVYGKIDMATCVWYTFATINSSVLIQRSWGTDPVTLRQPFKRCQLRRIEGRCISPAHPGDERSPLAFACRLSCSRGDFIAGGPRWL